jgi:hypothetical protein
MAKYANTHRQGVSQIGTMLWKHYEHIMKTYENHQFIHFHDPTRPLPDRILSQLRSHGSTFHWNLRVAAIVLKNKTEIIKNQQKLAKNIKNHETNEIWSDSSTLGPYLASDTQTVIAPSSISQDLGPIRECLQIRQRLETNEIWMRFEWDLSRNFCDFSHFRSL